MNLRSQAAMNAYVAMTWHFRRRALRRLCRQGRAPVVLIFYHRVADYAPNNWTIRNGRFQEQMRWLQSRADLVSLAEAQRRLREGNDRLAVSITFDDGYADNCEQALPFLIQHRIPCTYFVSLDFVATGRAFPHDRECNPRLQPNTIEQLRQLVNAGIEMGAHTRNHIDLGCVTDGRQLYDEVVASSDELAGLVGQTIRYFAFPYGCLENLNLAAARLAQEHGMQAVVSAFGGYNIPYANGFYLRRIHGDPEFARLRNWVTLDPRKLRAANDDDLFMELAGSAEMVAP